MAAGFPTTVNPILQNGLVPVFVDVELPTYNVDVDALRAAVSPRTRAVMIAHTLGNPYDLDAVTALCAEHDLLLVEDCCDALGSTWRRPPRRHVRRPGDAVVLPGAPDHHRRGRRRADQPAEAEEAGRVVPRLGSGLLVRVGLSGHLRQAVHPAARRPAVRLRPQVRLLARRLQPQGDRPAGGDRPRAAGAPGGFVEARRANHAHLREALAAHEDDLVLPGETPGADARAGSASP